MKLKLFTLLLILPGSLFSQVRQNLFNMFEKNGIQRYEIPFSIENKVIYGEEKQSSISNQSTIDLFDTVVFDLSRAVLNGDTIQFPVSILSDDSVFSLDFSLKYNHSDFIYDSTIDLTNNLQALSYYNVADSTVRFTSSSFQKYVNDSSILSIRFIIIAGPIDTMDFNNVHALLNGAVCSVKLINPLPVFISNVDNQNENLIVYPNPTSEILNILVNQNSNCQLFELNSGKLVFSHEICANQKFEMALPEMAIGLYLMKVYNGFFSTGRKVLIYR